MQSTQNSRGRMQEFKLSGSGHADDRCIAGTVCVSANVDDSTSSSVRAETSASSLQSAREDHNAAVNEQRPGHSSAFGGLCEYLSDSAAFNKFDIRIRIEKCGAVEANAVCKALAIEGQSPPTSASQARSLAQIADDPELKLILEDWEKRFNLSRSKIDRKEALRNNVKNEIYQLIGYFIVFQGVVLTAFAQSSALRCHNWLGPFTLSLLACIATVGGVVLKFLDFMRWKEGAEKEEEYAKVLSDQIDALKAFGKRFDFVEHAGDKKLKKDGPPLKTYFALVLTLVGLLAFSAIILLESNRILCHPGPGLAP